jgi:hypothetical protein
VLLLRARFLGTPTDIAIPAGVARESLEKGVREAFPGLEAPVREAAFAFEKTREGWTGEVADGSAGRAFDFDAFFPALEESLSGLRSGPVRLSMRNVRPATDADAAGTLVPAAVEALEAAPILFSEFPDGGGRSWNLTAAQLSSLLVPAAAGAALGVDAAGFDAFLDGTARVLEAPARDARFTIVDGKVAEFATSATGLALDRERMRQDLVASLGRRDATVAVALVTTQPAVATDQVNDLGIVEELGVGTSSFKGSPKNRVKNILNGVRLLDGLLIAPGTTFSLIDALKPFDEKNGYLPELVIKGDKIEPELGGGL